MRPVSGTLSLPSRGTFHPSLTVLSAIGHQEVFSLTRWSWQIHTGFLGPRDTWDPFRLCTTFRLRDWHPLWSAFQCRSPISRKSTCTSAEVREGPTTPTMQRLPAITHDRFGLFRVRSPLLTESLLFSLPVGTEMFHFPTFPPHQLYIHWVVTRHHSCWVSPFGHPRITARLTTPRGLSRPTTSFIGSWYQGIHRTP